MLIPVERKAKTWMQHNLADFRDTITGEYDATGLAEGAADAMNLYEDDIDFVIPEEVYDWAVETVWAAEKKPPLLQYLMGERRLSLAEVELEALVDEINSIPMYRGARLGDPRKLKGPSYFISSESFARTYGPTAAFQIKLKNPLVVSDADWYEYASAGWNPIGNIVERVVASGYDSVVNIRSTKEGPMYVVFLVYSKQAKLLD